VKNLVKPLNLLDGEVFTVFAKKVTKRSIWRAATESIRTRKDINLYRLVPR
jgi:hypothetical protein